MDSIVQLYLSCLDQISQDVIQEGETAKALRAFIENAEHLKNDIGDMKNNLSNVEKYYIEDIDEADSYLF